MTKRWDEVREELVRKRRRWLVTGAAGFIGSHLVERLLGLDQEVVGLDDFSTGSRENLADVERRVGPERWGSFRMQEGDIRDAETCRRAVAGAAFVLHQAALGSVPRSIAEPVVSHTINVDGFLCVLDAARVEGCERFVYASSSSVYGDDPALPKREEAIGEPLSPYAATKRIDEVYARTYANVYAQPVVGLRYFNVFGPRQDPEGPYAAVIPKWIATLLQGETPRIHGDGETSRDFCHVANAVQANLLAALGSNQALGRVFNVALGRRTTLNELFAYLRDGLAARGVDCATVEAVHDDFRAGDVRHSLADIEAARGVLGFEPEVDVAEGLAETLAWFAGSREG